MTWLSNREGEFFQHLQQANEAHEHFFRDRNVTSARCGPYYPGQDLPPYVMSDESGCLQPIMTTPIPSVPCEAGVIQIRGRGLAGYLGFSFPSFPHLCTLRYHHLRRSAFFSVQSLPLFTASSNERQLQGIFTETRNLFSQQWPHQAPDTCTVQLNTEFKIPAAWNNSDRSNSTQSFPKESSARLSDPSQSREDDRTKQRRTQPKCDICLKSFTRPASLKVHMRIHRGEKPFHCRFCNKTFTQSGNLIAHVRTHTGENPYCCQVCGRHFTQLSTKRSHMICHINRNGEE